MMQHLIIHWSSIINQSLFNLSDMWRLCKTVSNNVRNFKNKCVLKEEAKKKLFRELGDRNREVSIEEDGMVHTARTRGWPARENRVEKGGALRCSI